MTWNRQGDGDRREDWGIRINDEQREGWGFGFRVSGFGFRV